MSNSSESNKYHRLVTKDQFHLNIYDPFNYPKDYIIYKQEINKIFAQCTPSHPEAPSLIHRAQELTVA